MTTTLTHTTRVWIRRPLLLALGLLVALLAVAMLSLMVGTPRLSPIGLWEVLGGGGERLAHLTVLQLRLPRVCLGAMTGAMLGLSGALLQGALRNPLAGPELLGVSAGASVVMAAIIVLGVPVTFVWHPWLALAGGLLGGAVVLVTAQISRDVLRLVLIGAAVTALLNALVITIISLGNPNSIGLLFLYLLGSLANRTWEHVQIVGPWAAVGVPVALLCARPLNLLQLGDEMAEGLGLRVVATRGLLGLVAAGLVAAVVAVCGPIGWIALLAPHLTRQALGTSDARRVLPLAALIGAMLLLAADLLGRVLFAPVELPVGIWTTLVGGPVLLFLLRHTLRGKR